MCDIALIKKNFVDQYVMYFSFSAAVFLFLFF